MGSVLFVSWGLLFAEQPPTTPYTSGVVFTHPYDHPTWRFGSPIYTGTVTSVTGQSISIRYDGGGGMSQDRLKDGTVIELRATYAPRPPKKFEVSATLADGGYRRDGPSRHRLTDVRVDDVVNIFCERIEGLDVCTHIRIMKRPNGAIPPEPPDVVWVPPPGASPRMVISKEPPLARRAPLPEALVPAWGLVDAALWIAENAPPTPYVFRRVFIHPADQPGRNFSRQRYWGTVTAVTGRSMMVRYDGGVEIHQVVLKDGTTIEGRGLYARRPPKEFLYSEVLAQGGYRRDGIGRHRVSDVRVGDAVAIWYDRVEGVDVCTHIHIEGRVGGDRPPEPPNVEWEPPVVTPPPREVKPKPPASKL